MKPPSHRKIRRRRISLLAIAIVGCLAVLATVLSVHFLSADPAPAPQAGSSAAAAGPDPAIRPPHAKTVCNQPVLDSPYSYHGASGAYSSGTKGLPTYGTPDSDFPHDTAGMVLPAGKNEYLSYQLSPNTVYYLLPGTHTGYFQADANDAFVGGRSGQLRTILSGEYGGQQWAIDSNSSDGDQSGVTVEYLTVEKYQPNGNASAINGDSNTGWTIRYNTVTLNVPGAGVILGSDNVLKDNCLTLNGQYGFQSENTDSWGMDSLTGGPYDLTVEDNEISYNDTCDFAGLLNNPAIGWSHHNPVPAQYRNKRCGQVTPDGDQGGFKLWETNGVTIKDNYIHDNWGPGGWADTNNANTTWTGNTITDNEDAAIIEEVSYNFAITGNYIAGNNITDGLNDNQFPSTAIYISESGSDRQFGGVPACAEPSCAGQPSHSSQSVISGNTLVDNGGSVFLWQNSNRYCSGPTDGVCTLVGTGGSDRFTRSACRANLPGASVSTATYRGNRTGSPALDWWNGCLWETENVTVTRNTIDFNPAAIMGCNKTAWPACGSGGIFSEYGSPPGHGAGWIVPTRLTFFQNNVWSDNVYNGPSIFYAWNQGNDDNPVSWAKWTGSLASGDKCSSAQERKSGFCDGPFGQDSGSTYRSTPPS
jgi:hypothetical protein